MKLFLIATLIITLCACGAFPQPQTEKQILSKTAAKWVGRTVDELIVENGEPVGMDTLDSGVRVFEYNKIETGQVKSTKRKKREIRGGHEITFTGTGQLQMSTESIPQIDRSSTVKKGPRQPCRVLFTISASDVVESWSVEGNEDCSN